MARWRLIYGFLLVASVTVFSAGSAPAAITFNLDTVFSGDTPDGSPPWLTATFETTGADEVTLTLQANLSNGNFVQGVAGPNTNFGWGFNYSGDATDLAALVFTFDSGNEADGIDTGVNAFKADGDGSFDIVFGWDSSDRLVDNQSAVYVITGVTGLTEDDFDLTSNTEPGNGTVWHSAAHVQGIGDENEGSSWIGDGNGGVIPEPMSIIIWSILGLGGAGIAAVRRRQTLNLRPQWSPETRASIRDLIEQGRVH